MNAYETLGVPETATAEEIKKAGRQLAGRYHADNKETGDARRFDEVMKARAALESADARQRTDDELRRVREAAAAQKAEAAIVAAIRTELAGWNAMPIQMVPSPAPSALGPFATGVAVGAGGAVFGWAIARMLDGGRSPRPRRRR